MPGFPSGPSRVAGIGHDWRSREQRPVREGSQADARRDYGAAASVVPVIENVERSPLTPGDREKIFRENAHALLASKGVAI